VSDSPRNPRHPALDDVSRSIVSELQADGRRAYAQIGRSVGLSEAAVRQRVQKLVDTQAMQIVAIADPAQLGFARQGMLGIKTDGDPLAAADAIAKIDEVIYLVVTAGSFDLLCEVVAVDDDHLLQIISTLRAVPGVRSTETFVYLDITKQTYNWGIA
jgi:Lrp/AsnC family transcriptional regulator for asnA, asnC and gidA